MTDGLVGAGLVKGGLVGSTEVDGALVGAGLVNGGLVGSTEVDGALVGSGLVNGGLVGSTEVSGGLVDVTGKSVTGFVLLSTLELSGTIKREEIHSFSNSAAIYW